ncbi:MAG: hypothetical protein ABIT04_00745 [Novosphingobium sp.]
MFAAMLSAVGVFCLNSPAFAAEESARDRRNGRNLVGEFADCVVKVNAPLARGTILQNLSPGQIARNRLARQLINDSCAARVNQGSGVNLSFGSDLFRYSIAEALVRKDYAVVRHFDFSSASSLNHCDPSPLNAASANGTDARSRAAQAAHFKATTAALLSRFGECVTRRSPDGVQKLLLSAPASAAENTAFAELAPFLGQCLTSGQVRLSREVVRGALGLNFYRLAGAPAGTEVTTLREEPDA